MTPTERERIEKEAKEFANPWTPPSSNRRVAVDSYIAGATAEHERNAKLISSLKIAIP